MSKSYRRPYASVTGNRSAKQDKIHAHRGERRAHAIALRKCQDWEEFVPPVRYECHHNNVYDWTRDGRQRYQGGEWRGLNNIYHFSYRHAFYTFDTLIAKWGDRKARYEEWQKKIRRK